MERAISVCMKKYVNFSGRASRSEYWFFQLFYFIMYVIGAITTFIGTVVIGSEWTVLIMYLFILPFMLPLLAALIRRMHDVGRSGWFVLVPIYSLVLACTASDTGTNKYGDL